MNENKAAKKQRVIIWKALFSLFHFPYMWEVSVLVLKKEKKEKIKDSVIIIRWVVNHVLSYASILAKQWYPATRICYNLQVKRGLRIPAGKVKYNTTA